MQTALILMTILGCDDSATQCHYVEMLDQRWATIQECDASSQDMLKLYSNIDYPVVVAVCQTPEDTGLADAGEAQAASPEAAPTEEGGSNALVPKADIPKPVTASAPETAAASAQADTGFAARALKRIKDVLPEAESLKALASEPVHVVTDSYSWVARRFEK